MRPTPFSMFLRPICYEGLSPLITIFFTAFCPDNLLACKRVLLAAYPTPIGKGSFTRSGTVVVINPCHPDLTFSVVRYQVLATGVSSMYIPADIYIYPTDAICITALLVMDSKSVMISITRLSSRCETIVGAP